MRFTYLGRVDAASADADGIRLSTESCGPLHDPTARRPYAIDVTALVTEGHLRVDWAYGEPRHSRAEVAATADAFVATLRSLIVEARSRGPAARSSEFPDADLTDEGLEHILARLGRAGEGSEARR